MKIAIFVIAYNAEKTLTTVLDRIPLSIWNEAEEIFIFDDCSKDQTYEEGIKYIMKKFNERNTNKLKVYKNEKNQGYGGNQKVGYSYAINKGYDLVIMLHADGQYAPEELPNMIDYVKKHPEISAVFGSRILGNPLKGGMPLYKFIGNKILTFFENLLIGTNLSEFHSGYRLYNCNDLKKINFQKCSNNFHFDTEIIIMLHCNNMRIKEIPISTFYGDEICHVNSLKYGLDVLKAAFKYRLHKLKINKYNLLKDE